MSAREQHITIERSARFFAIGDAATAQELWVVCHGYGQLAARFIRDFAHIATPERMIVAPEGLHRFYLDPPPAPAAQRRVGATWMTREDREADIADYVRYLDAVVESLTEDPQTRRIRALGFSQGSATVFRWAALGRTRIDELILWSGEVPPDVDMQPAAQRLRQTRITIVHGSADPLQSPDLARRQLELLDAAGLSYRTLSFDGGHTLDRVLLAEIAETPLI
jgi:predicted esterase